MHEAKRKWCTSWDGINTSNVKNEEEKFLFFHHFHTMHYHVDGTAQLFRKYACTCVCVCVRDACESWILFPIKASNIIIDFGAQIVMEICGDEKKNAVYSIRIDRFCMAFLYF